MQNRYVADIGDYGKYGLLRWLAGGTDGRRRICLGLIWYLVPDESHTNDGDKVGYLEGDRQRVASCDPQLYDALKLLLRRGDRSVYAVRSGGILPADTVFFEETLSYANLSRTAGRRGRAEFRAQWLQRALNATAACDLVFVDPDNGLQCSIAPTAKTGPKYVFLEELAQILARDQGLVIYHHLSRQATALAQIAGRLDELQGLAGTGWRTLALWYRRGGARAFLLAVPDHMADIVEARVATFCASEWAAHFSLVRAESLTPAAQP